MINTVAQASQQFHLMVDRLQDAFARHGDQPPRESDPSERFDVLPVPGGLSYLSGPHGAQPFRISRKKPAGSTAYVLLEPVRQDHQRFLVVLNPLRLPVRLNGVALPPVALLSESDQLQWDSEHTLHVTLHNRPYLGQAPSSAVGEKCPICRQPINAGTTVYVCPICLTATHYEGEEKEAAERLECGRLSPRCPTCHRDKIFEEGYSYHPELCCG
jgi:hypothetical protein